MTREPIHISLILMVLTVFLFVPPAEAFQLEAEPDVDALLDRATERTAEMDESAARELYSSVLEIDESNYEALWNLSLLHSKEGYRMENRDEMERNYRKAREYAESCLDRYPGRANCHYVHAVALGRSSENAGPRTRLRASKVIKKHIEKALDLEPDHRGAWHLLGVWHTSAANLSRSERIAANLLFGGTPQGASNEAAELALQRAVELDPENILFHLDLARFYRDMGWREDAVEVLERTLTLEPKDKDDPRDLRRARELLERLRR